MQDWRVMLFLGAITPSCVFMALLLEWFPESPRWLVAQGRPDAARKALEQLLGADAESTLRDIQDELGDQKRAGWGAFLLAKHRFRLVAAIGSAICTFLSGSAGIMMFMPLLRVHLCLYVVVASDVVQIRLCRQLRSVPRVQMLVLAWQCRTVLL